MRTLRTHFAGVEMEIQLDGDEIAILGFYDAFPSRKETPDATICVGVEKGYEQGREMLPSHPAFDSTRLADRVFAFSRFNASGTVDFSDESHVQANFRCGLLPNTLEAIIRIVASIALPRHGALILHSSAVADARGAQIFSGVSGAGKSTIAAMLDESYPVQKVSDELLLAYRKADRWIIGVSPFLGSADLPHGSEYPVVAVNFLEQWPAHIRSDVSAQYAMGELCKHVLTYTRGHQGFQDVLNLVADMVTSVQCHQLRFAKEASVSEVLGITC